MSLAVDEFPVVDGLFVLFEFEVWWRVYLIDIDVLFIDLVVFEESYELLDGLWWLADGSDNWSFEWILFEVLDFGELDLFLWVIVV